MASRESNLPALYTELSKFGQNGEYERALKTANRSKQPLRLLDRIGRETKIRRDRDKRARLLSAFEFSFHVPFSSAECSALLSCPLCTSSLDVVRDNERFTGTFNRDESARR